MNSGSHFIVTDRRWSCICRRRLSGFLAALVMAGSLAVPAATADPAVDEEKIITDFLWQRVVAMAPPDRPRVALVLGGGGARGLAHIGVLKVLAEEKIPIDMIVGTSVGALIGALYAADVPMSRIEQLGETVRWNDLTDISDSSLVRLLMAGHLLSTDKMESFLRETIGDRQFNELRIPFACLATDLITGERVLFREGNVAQAARASATIPGLFDPVEFRHRYLVDGGLFDNIPTDVAQLMKADVIIAVSVSADFTKNKISNVFMILTQAIYIQGSHFDEERLKLADAIIAPQISDVTAVDLGRSRECIDAGVLAARQEVAAIKRMLIEKIPADRMFR